MPDMDSTQATKIIITFDSLKDLPIIALTVNALIWDKERFIESGMNDYISKHINSKKLEEIIRKYL